MRRRVLGVAVDAIDIKGATEIIRSRIKDGDSPGCVLAVNPEKVFLLRRNPDLLKFYDDASLVIPDGIGVVLALRLLYRNKVRRVPGVELMESICALSAEQGYRIFIYGAREGVNAAAVEMLCQRYPRLKIVGRANGYLDANEMSALVESINDSRADILFVGLGSPAQELWIQNNLPHLRVKVCQAIGGSLDVIAGVVRRAPTFFRRFGLEWFYRLMHQPSRIWRQRVLPWFAWEVLMEKMGKDV